MGENTKIGWTHGPSGETGHTFNGWRGCAHALLPDGTTHQGCPNCYAELGYGTRYGIEWGEVYLGGTREIAAETTWRKLLSIARRAALLGVFERVFMFSLGDVFEAIIIPPSIEWPGWPAEISSEERSKLMKHAQETAASIDAARTKLWDYCRWSVLVCGGCGGTRHDNFAALRIGAKACTGSRPKCKRAKVGGLVPLLLTKRPRNVGTMFPQDLREYCAIGGSVADQPSAEAIVPALLELDGFALRFISLEPQVGPVNLDLSRCEVHGREFIGNGHPDLGIYCTECAADGWSGELTSGDWLDPFPDQGINWVIVGGESGKGQRFRPFHLDHARAVVKQAKEAGVKVFVKQMGELPVITAAEWEALGERDGFLMRTPMLKAKRKDHAPEGTVPLLFTGTGTNPSEWAHLFQLPADELQEVPLIHTPATSSLSMVSR